MTTEIREQRAQSGTKTGMPRIGFLGLGAMGKHRLEAIQHAGKSEVVALCDPFTDHVDRLCKDNDLKSMPTYDSLIDMDVHGVVIATPNIFHKDQIIKALTENKAVFCQKPLACTTQEVLEIIQLAKEKNCALTTDLSYRHTHSLRKIKTLIDSGELGEIFAANLTFHNAAGPDHSWYYDPALSGGGCMMDLGVHLIDSLYWLFPDIKVEKLNSKLYVRGQALCDPKNQVEDFAIAQATFSNGLTSQLTCSWGLSIGKEAIIEMNFYGTKGGATFRNVNGSVYDFKSEHYKGTKRQVLSLPPDDWGGKDAVHWATWLANKNEYFYETDHYLKTAQLLDQIYSR